MNIGDESATLDSNVEWKDNIEHEVTQEDITPYVGMEFDTEDHAYRFYNMYVGFIGFSIRKDWRNTSKLNKEIVISRKYACFKEDFKRIKDHEGKIARKDVRTGCLAHMVIGRASTGKYVVTTFAKEHNHELATPKSRHKLPSQRRVSVSQAAEVDMATRSGIRQKLIFEFMSRQAGGRENVGCTAKDISNHLSSKRMKEMEEGEAYTLLHYFLKAMCGKKPKTIFTDQDAAMAKAIAKVLPESYHRLCIKVQPFSGVTLISDYYSVGKRLS